MKRFKRKKKTNYDKITKNRFITFLIIIALLFSIVGVKIVNVMIFDNKDYTIALNNLTYTEVSGTSSPRGRIYDRNYNIVVDNKSKLLFEM